MEATTKTELPFKILAAHELLATPNFFKRNGLHPTPIYIILFLMLIIFMLGIYFYVRISACRNERLKDELEREKRKSNNN